MFQNHSAWVAEDADRAGATLDPNSVDKDKFKFACDVTIVHYSRSFVFF